MARGEWVDEVLRTSENLKRPSRAGRKPQAQRPKLVEPIFKDISQIPKLYNVKEAAECLRVHPITVHKWLGIYLEPTRQGRNIFFTAQQIADCRERREKNLKLPTAG